MVHCKKKKSKYTPTTNLYDFAKKVWSLEVYRKIIYKIGKTTLKPSVWSYIGWDSKIKTH
jgi:hypothetical protein